MSGRQTKTDDKVRVQIVVREKDLKVIDRAARRRGVSRTLFLVSTARDAAAETLAK